MEMSKEYIIYPKDVILLFECNGCDFKKEKMSSNAVYDGPPTCHKCHRPMDLLKCRVICPDKHRGSVV